MLRCSKVDSRPAQVSASKVYPILAPIHGCCSGFKAHVSDAVGARPQDQWGYTSTLRASLDSD